MFHQANNFIINGGQFTVADNNHDAVSTILWHHVAPGAMFDSDERHSAGRCHPRTRQWMIERIKEWIRETSPAKSVVWMYGSAGAGKSSLMQSICEFLRDSDPETKGASFFFARGNTDRGKGTKLFVTLAYQLAVQFPSIRAEINNALYRDPTLPTKSMDIQLRSLIIDPLLRCNALLSTTPILFIDGLDECGVDDTQGVDTQCQIITLISQSLLEAKIPIRWMIASRPEYWIRDSFEASPLSDITVCLSLRDDFDVDKDIRVFLTEKFEQIRSKKSRVMGSVALPWPPEHIVDRFVEEASGQYIYASTILKFVGDHPFKNPEEQLRVITTPGPHRATAYSELDRLYATIVSAYPGWESMKRVLGGFLVELNLIAIQVLLRVPRAEITLILDALRSLIDVVPPTPLSEDDQLLVPIFGPLIEDEKISICHLSFREFLLDEARSGLYYINIEAIQMEVVGAFLGIIQYNLDQNYDVEPNISFNIGISEYRRMMQATLQLQSFSSGVSYDFQALFPLLNSIMERFRRFDPSRRMNHPACFMRDMDFLLDSLKGMESMIHAKQQATQQNPGALSEQGTTMDSFLAIANQLQHLARMARKIGIHLLSVCDGFNITTTLFFICYLTMYGKGSGLQFSELLMNPGCTVDACLSTIQQHRHIISLSCDKVDPWRMTPISTLTHPGSSVFISVDDLGGGFSDSRLYWPVWKNYGTLVDLGTSIQGWLCRSEWKNQRVSLACECLKSIMNHLDNKWEHFSWYHEVWLDGKDLMLADFFNSTTISNIQGEDYFGNKCHLSFLAAMVDSKAWLALFPTRPKLWTNIDSVVNPILCWFNRQLTNPTAMRLMVEHDVSLPQKMKTAMNCVFQHCFMPIFKTPYSSELLISTVPKEQDDGKSIRIKGLQSGLLEEKTVFIEPEGHPSFYIPTFLMRQDIPPPIPTSQWYPCLASYLLNIMVKNLYRKFRPEYGYIHNSPRISRHGLSDSSLYTVQCLPYAQTTPQNLGAFRALKYLYEQVDSWYPPPGFCIAAGEFLKRYEPSLLSSEELSQFEHWLQGIKEGPDVDSLQNWNNFD